MKKQIPIYCLVFPQFDDIIYAVRRIMWTPESVQTVSLSSPTLSWKAASSNGFCIAPRPKVPRSPPFLAELQSEYLEANSANDARPEVIWSLYPLRRLAASSFERVMLSDLHEDGRLDSQCLTNK